MSLPSYAATLAAVKDGSIFSGMETSISSMTSMASALPSSISSTLSTAVSGVSSQVAAARASMPRDLSIAQSNMDALAREQIASRSDSDTSIPSLSSLSSGADNLAVLREGPSLLKTHTDAITSSICSNSLVNASFSLSSTDPSEVASTISSFTTTIPAQTIASSTDASVQVINPEFVTFSADASNKAKMDALGIPQVDPSNVSSTLSVSSDSLASALSSAASNLTSEMTSLVNKAKTATAAAISNLKAAATAMILAATHNDTIQSIKTANIDTSKISALSITKSANLTALYSPSIPTPNPVVNGFPTAQNVLSLTPAMVEAAASDRVQSSELDSYLSSTSTLKLNLTTSQANFTSSPEYVKVKALQDQATVIASSKPDITSRTVSEQAIMAQYEQASASLKGTASYQAYSQHLESFNASNNGYQEAVTAYTTNSSRDLLDSSTLSDISNLA